MQWDLFDTMRVFIGITWVCMLLWKLMKWWGFMGFFPNNMGIYRCCTWKMVVGLDVSCHWGWKVTYHAINLHHVSLTGQLIYIYIYIHPSMHACMHAYIHTYIHSCTHTHILSVVLDPNAINLQFGMVCYGWIACFCYPLLPVGWSIVTTLLANLTCVFFSPLMCWIWCGQNKVRHGDPTATWSRWPTAIARSSKSCTATSEKVGASATRRDKSMASQSGSNALDEWCSYFGIHAEHPERESILSTSFGLVAMEGCKFPLLDFDDELPRLPDSASIFGKNTTGISPVITTFIGRINHSQMAATDFCFKHIVAKIMDCSFGI